LFKFSNLSIRIVFTGGDKTAPVGAPKPAKAGSATDADNTLAAATEIDAIFSRSRQDQHHEPSPSVVVTSSSRDDDDDDDDDDSRVITNFFFFIFLSPLLLPLVEHGEDAHRGDEVAPIIFLSFFSTSELSLVLALLSALCSFVSVGKNS
jgi:hypothetical protein